MLDQQPTNRDVQVWLELEDPMQWGVYILERLATLDLPQAVSLAVIDLIAHTDIAYSPQVRFQAFQEKYCLPVK